MLVIYTALKVSALLVSIILPLARPDKRYEDKSTTMSKWVVNANGELEDTSGVKDGYHI